jgi:Flp pilus assembly protein TadG
MKVKVLAEVSIMSLFNRWRTRGSLRPAGPEAGASVVEVALLIPFVMLIFFGMIDLGRWVFLAIEVTSAARAGAQYGSLHYGNTSNTSGITTAAANDVPDIGPACTATVTTNCLTVTTNTSSCWCANAPGTVVTCSTSYPYTSCSSSSQIVLLQVNTSATYTPWISIAPFKKTFTITGQAIVPTGQY